jgi:hypothetical protein
MADSVALLRSKIDDMSLAVQDGTMNSVITLATIEVRCPDFLLFNPTTDFFLFSLGKGIPTSAKCM